MKLRICVFTGSRAEYGLLKPLLNAIKKDKGFSLHLVVSGAHLSPEFGLTVNEILEDGFAIDEKVEILLSSDTAVGIGKSMGLGLIGFSDALGKIDPDVAIVLGDRYETFSFTAAAFIQRRVIIHLHGGELTSGALDDSFRHAITKMSHYHMVSTEEYRRRVIQLGESPERVYNVGALGVENTRSKALLSRSALERSLGFRFMKRNLLVTVHPETLSRLSVQELCGTVLESLVELKDTMLIFTKSNADENGRVINGMIDKFVSRNPERAISFVSLGQVRYLSLLRCVNAVVGNSSSGIIEAPSFKIGTVDIGDRQKGRVRAASVINCPAERNAILEAFRELYSERFQNMLPGVVNPYGDGKTSEKIIAVIKARRLNRMDILKKGFYDLPPR
jgi:GDP/UDP-N,N'-diacetylbacillosamine 2-epimerase (hydrolysing)